jgi:WD40 repeat protein/energy-coupling factor transporter ATP-binding protein EcfA2
VTELVAAVERSSAPLPATPYVGLVPYTEDDASFFFGRDAEKSIVTANLRGSRLTLLYGPSGVGKTSLLQAGVVHDLRGRVARNATSAPERAAFAIAVFRGWRDEPLPVLMEEIRLSVLEAAPGGELDPWQPGEDPVETLRGWTERARKLLVVLDQFEDYFLYHPNESGEGTFDGEFPRIVNDPNLRVNFLVSIREDAWAKLDRFEGRVPQLFANYVRVEHLDPDGAREAVEGPVAEYNRRLPGDDAEFTIEQELVDAVVAAATASGPGVADGGDGMPAATDQVETPFLQLVMERLWRATVDAGRRALTLATLTELGGAQRIVETHLVDALGALSPREREIAADAFRYLVTSSRRRVVQAASDLSEWLSIPEEELVPVLEKLASGESGRILRPVPPPPGLDQEGSRYEIFHDVLGEPILEWRREFEREREREAEARRQRAVRRRLALIVAGLLVLVLVFAGFAAWALHERSVAADRAAEAESQALAARSLRVQSLDPKQSLVLASEAEGKRSTPQADEAMRRALVSSPKPTVLVPAGRTVYGVDFSPSGQLVATAGKGARVTSVTGQTVATLVPRKTVTSVRFSPDGRFVVAAMGDGGVRVWRVSGWGELPSRARARGALARAALTKDGRFLVTGGYPGWPNHVWRFANGRIGRELTKRDDVGGWIEPDGTARVVDAQTYASAARLARKAPYSFASSPSGKIFVGASGSATPVYHTRTGVVFAKLPPTYSDVELNPDAAVSPDGSLAAIQEVVGAVIWDLQKREPKANLAQSNAATSFSPDGRLVVSADDSQDAARVWDPATGAVLAELPPQPPRFSFDVQLQNPYGPVAVSALGAPGGAIAGMTGVAFEPQPSATFSPDGDLVATWGWGGAKLWEPFGTREVKRLGAGSLVNGRPLSTAISPDGRLVAKADANHLIEVRRTQDGRSLATLRGSTGYVSRIAFSPSGDLVAAASFDRGVRVWRVSDGRLVRTLSGHTARVGDVAFSPDGELLASASQDRTARIWRVADGASVRVLREPNGPVTSVAFSRDGDTLVTGGGGGTARVWSTGDWKQRAVLGPTRSRSLVLRALPSRDGRYVVTLDLDDTARIWRGDGGSPIKTLKNVASVAFSPSGNELLVAGGEATARILQASDGREIGLLRGHTDIVNDARFSPKGDLIVTSSDDGTVRVWQTATNGTVATLAASGFSYGEPTSLREAMLAADGRLVTLSDGGVRLYACEPCLGAKRLKALAKERLGTR